MDYGCRIILNPESGKSQGEFSDRSTKR